jgi:hypothetical protein
MEHVGKQIACALQTGGGNMKKQTLIVLAKALGRRDVDGLSKKELENVIKKKLNKYK